MERKTEQLLVGNNHIELFLAKCIAQARKEKNFSGTFIFLGSPGIGKAVAANLFAKSLFCESREEKYACGKCSSCLRFIKAKDAADEDKNLLDFHSDLYIIRREADKKNISVEQIREFVKKLSMSSFLNSFKIGIIESAESLSEEAANALLKTVEEPHENVIIILVTSSLESMPSTIASRSQILEFKPVKTELIYDLLIERGAARSEAKIFSHLSLGRPALALKFLKDREFFENYKNTASNLLKLIFNTSDNSILEEIYKENESAEIINIWESLARDLLLSACGNNDLLSHNFLKEELIFLENKIKIKRILAFLGSLNKGRDYIGGNVNPRLVLDNIALNI